MGGINNNINDQGMVDAPTASNVLANLAPGTYIIPKQYAQQALNIRQATGLSGRTNLSGQPQLNTAPKVFTENGEVIFTPEEAALAKKRGFNLDRLVDQTNPYVPSVTPSGIPNIFDDGGIVGEDGEKIKPSEDLPPPPPKKGIGTKPIQDEAPLPPPPPKKKIADTTGTNSETSAPKLNIAGDVPIESGESTTGAKPLHKDFKTVEDIKKEGGKPNFSNYVASAAAGTGEYIVNNATKIAEGAKEVGTALGKSAIESVLPTKKPITEQIKQQAHNGLDMLLGGAKAAFGAASFTPVGVAVNEVGEHLPESVNQWLFSPAHKIAEQFGYEQKNHEGELKEKALSVADLVSSLLLMKKAGEKGGEAYDAIKEKISKKEPLNAEESKQVADVLAQTTPEELKTAVKDNEDKLTPLYERKNEAVKIVEKAKEGENITKDIAKSDLTKDEFHQVVDLAKEGGHISEEKATELKKNFENVEKAKETVPEEHKDNPKIVELVAKKNELLEKKKTLDSAFHPAIDEQIKGIDRENGTHKDGIDDKIINEIKKQKDEQKETENNSEAEALRVLNEDKNQIKTEENGTIQQRGSEEIPLGETPRNSEKVDEGISEPKASTGTQGGSETPKKEGEQTIERKKEEKIDIAKRNDFVEKKTKELQLLPDEEYVKNFIDEGHLNSINANREFGLRPNFGLDFKDVKKGIDDIKNNKDTAAARHLKEAILKTKETGKIPMISGTGGIAERGDIPLAEFHEENATELKPHEIDKLAKEYDDHFNSLTEEQKQQEYENTIEGINEGTKGKEDVGNKETSTVKGEVPSEEVKEPFISSLKQRHLPQEWLEKIKEKSRFYEPKLKEVYNNVVKDVESNKITDEDIRSTIDKAINKEGVNEKDAAIILVDRTRLKNMKDEVQDKIDKAIKEEDTFGLEQLNDDLETINSELLRNDEASFQVGQRFGKLGNMLQQEAKEDYSLSNIISAMNKSNIKNLDISAEKKKVEELVKKLEESEKKYNELQKNSVKKRAYTKIDIKNIDEWSVKAKKSIDEFLSLGAEGAMSNPLLILKPILHSAIDAIAVSLKGGILLKDAIKTQVDKFKESDFYKKLNDKDKDNYEKNFENILTKGFEKTSATSEFKKDYEKVLEDRIKQNEKKIANYKVGEIAEKKQRVLTPKEKELVDKNDALKKELQKLRSEDILRTDLIRKRNKETRILNELPKLQEKLKQIEETGDYTKETKTNVPMSPEIQQKATEVQQLRNQISKEKQKIDFKNTSWGEKALFYSKKWIRFAILSGIKVLGKLASAAAERVVFDVPDMVASESFGKVFSDLAKQSPEYFPIGYGKSFNVKGEAMKKMFNNYGNNIISILKTGQDDIAMKFGKDSKEWNEHGKILDFWNGVHGILKNPIKRMGFLEGIPRATAYAVYHGMPLDDIGTQTFIAETAYNIGKRKIFLQDNAAADVIKNGIKSLEKIHPALGALAYSDVPITKVPVNFIGEHLERSFGLITFAGRALKDIALPATKQFYKGIKGKGEKVTFGQAINKAVSDLTPDQANKIVRQATLGTTGAAIFAIGYYKHKEIKDIIDAMPEWAQHHPQIVLLKMGVNTGEVSDASKSLSKGFKGGAAKGLIKEVANAPLMGNVLHTGMKLGSSVFGKESEKNGVAEKTANFFSDYFGQKVQEVNPVILKNVAEALDTDEPGFHPLSETTKRNPKGFIEQIEAGLPILRKNLPEKGGSKEGKSNVKFGKHIKKLLNIKAKR